MTTPCGLTQEKLDAHAGWLNVETGMCNAPFKNVNGETQRGCGELYASHPSSAQAQAGGGGQGQGVSSLITAMDNLMVETKFETTASQQGVASSFCTQTPQGFGYLPSSVRFDPTHECEHSLHGMLIPTQEEIDGAPRLRLCGEKAGLQSWGETEASGVTSQLNDACALYPGLQGNGQSRLNSRNLGEGIASGTSYEDFQIGRAHV